MACPHSWLREKCKRSRNLDGIVATEWVSGKRVTLRCSGGSSCNEWYECRGPAAKETIRTRPEGASGRV